MVMDVMHVTAAEHDFERIAESPAAGNRRDGRARGCTP